MAATIRRLGWACVEITSGEGTRIVVDPYLEGDPDLGLTRSPYTVADLASAQLVAVTHAGFDHLGQAIEIVKAGEAMLLCGGAIRLHARRNGVPKEKIVVMPSGAQYRYRDLKVKAVDARHLSFMKSQDDFLTDQPLSFVVSTAAGERIFCGGDTSISGDLKVWGELYRPQVAVLGIGGVALDTTEIVELPPDEAAMGADWLGVQYVIPVHYVSTSPAPQELVAHLAERGSKVQVVALEPGEAFELKAGGT